MTRITPRTCLWPLAGSLTCMFALSIGLTFRSNHHCFAGTCGEWLFPLQARLHVVVWYCWLSISVTFLAIRAFHPSMRKVLRHALFERKLPLLGKQLAVSGTALFLWVVCLYGVLTGIWWSRLQEYFDDRGNEGGVTVGNRRLAAIALTGHYCDVTMGMALIPISRHSALASFFKISVATTLTFHMITAYTLFCLVTIHGLLYVAWIPVFESLSDSFRMVYPVLNPTYLYHETWPGLTSGLGVWRASLIFTGCVTAFIMCLLFVTTLPIIRSRHFNIFYFTHLLSIVAVIIVCLHASTMFYCTSPGIMMWLLDWGMRLYELRTGLDGKITALGRGWYNLTIPLPRRRLDGCACKSPLAHFYIYHPESSIRELHPFTTTTHLASQNMCTHRAEENISIQFLFRKRGKSSGNTEDNGTTAETSLGFAPSLFALVRRLRWQKKKAGQQMQWTDKLASLADDPNIQMAANEAPLTATSSSVCVIDDSNCAAADSSKLKEVAVALRLEGPYFTPADPARYSTVVCIVAGTGVSGALAIANAFTETHRQAAIATSSVRSSIAEKTVVGAEERRKPSIASQLTLQQAALDPDVARVWRRCVVIWSVREADYVELHALAHRSVPGLDVRIHKTGNGRARVDIGAELDKILEEDGSAPGKQGEKSESMWCYVSGPNAFIHAGEVACKERQSRGVDWYGAKWEI